MSFLTVAFLIRKCICLNYRSLDATGVFTPEGSVKTDTTASEPLIIVSDDEPFDLSSDEDFPPLSKPISKVKQVADLDIYSNSKFKFFLLINCPFFILGPEN